MPVNKTHIHILMFILMPWVIFFPHDTQAETSVVNQPIQLIERAAPKYPSLAMAQGIEGWVKVMFTISETGEIVDVEVADASPAGVFDVAAINAVKQFVITPKIENGVPMAQRASQTIEFELPADHEQKVKELEEQLAFKIKNGQMDPSMFAVPSDIHFIITSIESKSKIKLHKRTLQTMDLMIESDASGIPESVKVMHDDLGHVLSQENLDGLKQEMMFFASKSHHFFAGYYNPYFTMQYAKNMPADIQSQMVAKNMPIPQLRFDYVIKAKLSISKEGDLLEISETSVNDEVVPVHMVQDMFKLMNYSPAVKKYEFVEDEIEVKLIMTAVQKDDVKMIRSQYFDATLGAQE